MKKILLLVTLAVTALCVSAQESISTSTLWNVSTWEAGYYEGTVVDGLTFSGVVGANKDWKNEANKKTVDGVEYTNRIKAGGGNRTITLTTTTGGTFKYIGISSSSSDATRKVSFTLDGVAVGEAVAMDGSTPYWYSQEFANGGTIVLTVSAGINFYAFEWVAAEVAPVETVYSGWEKSYTSMEMTWQGLVVAQTDYGYIAGDITVSSASIVVSEPMTQYAGYFGVPTTMTLVKGEGDNYVFNTQLYVNDPDQGSFYLISVKESEGEYVVDTEKPTINFAWRNDSLIMEEGAVLGLAAYMPADEAAGTPEMYYVLSNEQGVVINKPQEPITGITGTEDYVLIWEDAMGNTTKNKVNVKVDGTDVYVGGLPDTEAGTFVKGELTADNKVIFKDAQPVGKFIEEEYSNHYIYFSTLDKGIIKVVDPMWGDTIETEALIAKEQLEFDYNAETGTLTSMAGAFVINKGSKVSFMNGAVASAIHNVEYHTPVLERLPDVAAIPADPTYLSYGVGFKMPLADVDGNYINPDKLYYNIYLDDQLIDINDYTDQLSESTINIPYTLKIDVVYQSSDYPESHYFVLPDSVTYDKIGVQMIYMGGGVESRSNIVYSDGSVVVSAVDVVKGNKEVVSVIYVDMAGRIYKNPANGFYIKTVKYSDGSIETSKVVLNERR